MRLRTPDVLNGARGGEAPGSLLGHAARALAISSIAAAVFLCVWLYGSALRDPHYLDGWLLAGGMSLQLGFHVALKTARMSPASVARWRAVHIFLGYALVAAFLSHTDLSLPDTTFEWMLWSGFVVVTASGIFGTYLAWSLRARRRIDDSISYERIPALRAELARDVEAAVAEANPNASSIALPGLPHDGWIKDLYVTHLRAFFQGPRNAASHLIGSQRPLQRLIDELDGLARYVDQPSRDKLAVIKTLAIEKDRLDYAHVFFGLNRGWQFVHVPVTYGLIVLVVLHVVVVYAFSSGDW